MVSIVSRANIEHPSVLCRKGLWRRISTWLVDEQWHELSLSERSWCLYALYFSGAWTDAESWLQQWRTDLSHHDNAHVFFARCVALGRSGQVQQAREEWIYHWRAFRAQFKNPNTSASAVTEQKRDDSEQRAWVRGWLFQAQSFLQAQRARWGAALAWSRFAERESFLASDLMLRALASDMLAHANVRRGFYAGAIRHAQLALNCARQMENRGVENAVRVSLACWQAERGERPDAALRTLRSLLNEKSFHDAYSQNVLLYEIARAQMLRGQFVNARKILLRAEKNLAGVNGRPLFRQKILLAQRRALLARLEGMPSNALIELESVYSEIPSFEDSLRLEVRGQMIAACLESGRTPPAEWLVEEQVLTSRVRSQRAFRTIARRNSLRSTSLPELADRLGELMDRLSVEGQSQASLRAAVEFEFPGLIGLLIDRVHENTLLVLPGNSPVILITPAGVFVLPEKISPQLIGFAVFLSDRLRSKEDIVRTIWNRRYLPERDDPNVYVLVRRLRRLLGEQRTILRSGRDGYSLNARVLAVTSQILEDRVSDQVETTTNLPGGSTSTAHLTVELPSLRIASLKTWLSQRASFSAEDWQAEAGISRASACRDIAQLVGLGLIKRMGRGPAAVYVPA